MADQLDTMFRELAESSEPVGLRSATDVRRRGDHRRRSTRAGAVVAVAILAVGTVGVVEATRTQADRGTPTIPADSPTALSATPLLTADDIPAIGPYESMRSVGPVDAEEPFRLACSSDSTMAPADWSGTRQLERREFQSDLEASLVETVVLFDDEDAAAAAAESFPNACDPDPALRGSTVQHQSLPGLDGSQRGLVTIPKGDADIGYNEVAVARDGSVLVVLDWASTGLPHGEDAESAQTWQWAIPKGLVATALDRASGPAVVQVIDPYELYTHCGIREAKIGDDYYRATPQLDDGNGNPPSGWGNPGQTGTMTVYDDGTARFTAGSLEATFTLRQGATDWLELCD